jgi:hypothetical protein
MRQEIPHVIETIGDDWIVFASDYSHFDSRFPALLNRSSKIDNSATHPGARFSTTMQDGFIRQFS